MKKRNWKRMAVNTAAAGLAVCLLAALVGNVRTAAAVTSLPHIESIVNALENSTSSFEILEIVPQKDSGSIGYYAARQEPMADWKEKLASMGSREERTKSMETMLKNLRISGLLGSTTTDAPLMSKGDYVEVLPWERTSGAYTALKLDHTEQTLHVTGTFTEKPVNAGSSDGYDYRAETTFEIRAEQNGGYVQTIDHVRPCGIGDVTAGTNFYYQPTFTKLDVNAAEAWPNQDVAVYVWVKNAEDETRGHYQYYDQLSNGVERGSDYYYVTATGAPSATLVDGATADVPLGEMTGWYAAPLDTETPYVKVDSNGWFDLTPVGYFYVGGGKGTFRYEKSAGSTWPVSTDTVFYTGGYVNNQWFLKKTMDVDDAKVDSIRVVVTSVTPDQIDQALMEKIGKLEFGLIVLSAGYAPDGSAVASYGSGNDVSQDAVNSLTTATDETNQTPVVVDNRLLSQTGTNIGRLAAALKSDSKFTGDFVSKNVYLAAAPLATVSFDAPFAVGNYKNPGTAFYDVYEEILHENALRKLPNAATTDLLREDVSMASTIRYIINYAHQRVVIPKDNFTVLDIEPGKNTALTKAKVLEWFPTGKYTEDNVSIVTMSTAEFIGKIEDVSENYDVVYVGSHCTFSTDYNDNNMNGLVYTNIGDTYRSGFNLSGLLDRDYYGNTGFIDGTSDTSANLYRFSGNDLTAAKVKKLQEFAATGYPVILADNLITDTSKDAETYTLTAKITSGGTTLSAAATLTSTADGKEVTPASVTYQWRKDGEDISGATNQSYTAVSSGVYTCRVSAAYGGQSTTAVSNALRVTRGKYFEESGSATNGSYPSTNSEEKTYTVYLTSTWNNEDEEGSVDITVDPVPGGTITYQWYGRYWYWLGWGPWYEVNKSSATVYTDDDSYDAYRCTVTIDGQSVTLPYVYRESNKSTSGELTIPAKTETTSFKVKVTNSGDTLTYAGTDPALDNVTAVWQKASGGSTSAATALHVNSLTVGDSYTCWATANVDGSVAAVSKTYTVKLPSTASVVALETPAATSGTLTIPAVAGTRGVNTGIVDRASQVYTLLDALKNNSNVKTVTAAKKHQATVYEALNLSKPKIKFQENGYPTKYKKDEETGIVTGKLESEGGNYYLTYQFQILNATDATPQTTRYAVTLSLDQDGDGNYAPSEILADILCKDAEGNSVELNALKGGTDEKNAPVYTVRRQMPSTAAGILPWKLKVTKTGIGNSYIHASTHNYTYIQPAAAKAINVLQINSTTHPNNGYNLQEQMRTVTSGGYFSKVTQKRYQGIYGKLLADVSKDFAVNITTITTDNFNNYSSYEDLNDNVQIYLGSLPSYTLNNSSPLLFRTSLLEQFDMVIMGFDDVYQELRDVSAQAVVNYKVSGRSILFAHDTTSFTNTEVNQMVTSGGDVWNTNSWSNWEYSSGISSSNGTHDLSIGTLYGYGTVGKSAGRLEKGTYQLTVDVTASSAVQISVKRSGGSSISFVPGDGTGANGNGEVLRYPSDGTTQTVQLNFEVTKAGKADILVWNSGYSSVSNTTYKNFTLTKVTTGAIGSYADWGYAFNRLLRSIVGLDRYGVVDSEGDGNVYTSAYAPGKSTGEIVPEIQGFTNHELLRYSQGSGGVYGTGQLNDNARLTKKVSQVNEGQITTYPFNINSDYFKTGKGSNTIPVAETHEQYYQLNLNADNIVVWYCLADDDDGTRGDYYGVSPNDVVNSYYIYSVGNVTYTGAGHSYTSDAINSNTTEAKLFVNTMIAAYRTARTKPSVQVVASPTDTTPITNYYLAADYEGSGYGLLEEESKNCPIYLVVTDTNLEADREIKVELSYRINGEEASYTGALPIYRASTGGQTYPENVNGTPKLISGMVYYFNLPQEVLSAFGAATSASDMNLNVSVSTFFVETEQPQICTTPYVLTAYKVGLLDLG